MIEVRYNGLGLLRYAPFEVKLWPDGPSREGVREYWIIDPRPYQQQADFYLLGEDELYHPAPPDEKGRYHSVVLPSFWLDMDWLWQENLRDPQLALAEIMISIDDLPVEAKDTYQALYSLLAGKS